MDISFDNNKLAKLANNLKELQTSYGQNCAKKIRRRLDDLKAATYLEELRYAPGRYHELKENRKGQIATDLEHPLRLIFQPANDPLPINQDGSLDWSRINSVCIIEIVDYH